MCFYVNIVLFREHVDLADGSVLNGKPVEMVRENRRGGHDKGEDSESGERQGSNMSILDSTTAERCSPSMMTMEERVTCHYFCKYSSDSQ